MLYLFKIKVMYLMKCWTN